MENNVRGNLANAWPAIGISGCIALIQWANSTPALWSSLLFIGCLFLLATASVVGVVAIFSHWKWRLMPPAFILGAYAAYASSANAWLVFALLTSALLATCYFVAPERNAPKSSPAPSPNSPGPMKRDVEPFRVAIDNLTVGRLDNETMVVAQIKVTNYGEPAAIQKWQMMYWRDGHKREAAHKDLQNASYQLEEIRVEKRWQQKWGFDDYIGAITRSNFAKGEPREGFFFASLGPNGLSEGDLRTIYMQYESDGETFTSPSVGANISYGTISLSGPMAHE